MIYQLPRIALVALPALAHLVATGATAAPGSGTSARLAPDTLVVLEARVEAAPAGPPPQSTDTTASLGRATCGRQLACVPGVDLRVVRVETPGETLPVGGRVPVMVEIQNRGASGSPVSEIHVCHSATATAEIWRPDAALICGGGRLGVLPLPAIRSGETVRATVQTLLPGERARGYLVAVVDPERSSGDRTFENNYSAGSRFVLEDAAFRWNRVDVVASNTDRSVSVHLALQNASTVASSKASEVLLSAGWCPAAYRTTPITHRVSVPALPPRGTFVAHLRVPAGAPAACRGGEAEAFISYDPDRPTQEKRRYQIP